MHTLLLTFTLIYKGVRGMGELHHDQERVGRPTLAFSRLILSEERHVQFRQDLARSPSRSQVLGAVEVRSVTCMHALLQNLTLMDVDARGIIESDHDRERVGRPSLTFSHPILSRKRRE
jgi:hypothetical protein